MKYLELRKAIQTNVFRYLEVVKKFNQEEALIKTQLHRFVKKGLLVKIKRGLYCFDQKQLHEFDLASLLYQPSYISLESALNYYGLIPDVPQSVTSVTVVTTKTIKNQFGRFSYAKIKPSLYFGFKQIKSANSSLFFNLAQKEKALLDYFYLRKIKNLADLRLDLKNINQALYQQYRQNYPQWVQRIKL